MLVELMAQCGTDKNTTHSYGTIYERLLAPLRDKATSILEIGVDRGHSLACWSLYFPKAMIYGIDSNPLCAIDSPRIKTFCARQDDARQMLAAIGDLTFDMIIDDGAHDLWTQVATMCLLESRVRPGGLYIIEDIQEPAYLPHFRSIGAEVYDLRNNKLRYDDILVVMRH